MDEERDPHGVRDLLLTRTLPLPFSPLSRTQCHFNYWYHFPVGQAFSCYDFFVFQRLEYETPKAPKGASLLGS